MACQWSFTRDLRAEAGWRGYATVRFGSRIAILGLDVRTCPGDLQSPGTAAAIRIVPRPTAQPVRRRGVPSPCSLLYLSCQVLFPAQGVVAAT